MGSRASLALSGVACAAALTSGVARADEPEEVRAPVGTALLVGGAISAVSVATGATMTVQSTAAGDKTQGVYVMGAGLSLAPFAAHAVLGEWLRGGLLALAPLATSTAMGTLVAVKPEVMVNSDIPSRRWFIGLYAATFALSAIATFDVVLGEKRKADRLHEERPRAFHVVPLLGQVTGLGLEGEL